MERSERAPGLVGRIARHPADLDRRLTTRRRGPQLRTVLHTFVFFGNRLCGLEILQEGAKMRRHVLRPVR